jgi:hypothetical protein
MAQTRKSFYRPSGEIPGNSDHCHGQVKEFGICFGNEIRFVSGSGRLHGLWRLLPPRRGGSPFRQNRARSIAKNRRFQSNLRERAFYDELLKWLNRYVETGEIRKLPPGIYFALCVGPANEFTRLWLMSDDRDPRKISRAESLLTGAGWTDLRVHF